MTVESFKFQQEQVRLLMNTGPHAWALRLNDMRMGDIEDWEDVAIFDTFELASEFMSESLLPDDGHLVVVKESYGGIVGLTKGWFHHFRPGLLWSYNRPITEGHGVVKCHPWVNYDGLPENPKVERLDMPADHEAGLTDESKVLLAKWREAGLF